MVDRLTLLIIFFSFTVIATATSQQGNFKDFIDFSIDKVEERNYIIDIAGKNGVWESNEGDKFVLIHFKIINKSNKKQIFNFDDVYLFDPNTEIQYKPNWLISLGLFTSINGVNFNLKSEKTIKKTLVFMFPKTETPQFIKSNNKIIEIGD